MGQNGSTFRSVWSCKSSIILGRWAECRMQKMRNVRYLAAYSCWERFHPLGYVRVGVVVFADRQPDRAEPWISKILLGILPGLLLEIFFVRRHPFGVAETMASTDRAAVSNGNRREDAFRQPNLYPAEPPGGRSPRCRNERRRSKTVRAVTCCDHPYDERPELASHAQPASKELTARYKTFCGT